MEGETVQQVGATSAVVVGLLSMITLFSPLWLRAALPLAVAATVLGAVTRQGVYGGTGKLGMALGLATLIIGSIEIVVLSVVLTGL